MQHHDGDDEKCIKKVLNNHRMFVSRDCTNINIHTWWHFHLQTKAYVEFMAFKSKLFDKLIASSHGNHTYYTCVDAMHEKETIVEHKKGHGGNVLVINEC